MKYTIALVAALTLSASAPVHASITAITFTAFVGTFFAVGGDEAVDVSKSFVRNIRALPGRVAAIPQPCYTETMESHPGYNYVTTKYLACE